MEVLWLIDHSITSTLIFLVFETINLKQIWISSLLLFYSFNLENNRY